MSAARSDARSPHPCGARDCDAPPTVQWARRLTTAETGDAAAVHAAARQNDVDTAADWKRSEIHELLHRIDLIPADDPDGPAMRTRLTTQVEAARAELAAAPAPAAARVEDDTQAQTQAVFACDDHALTEDAMAVLHQAGCLAPADPCSCPT